MKALIIEVLCAAQGCLCLILPRLNSSDSDGGPVYVQMVTALVLQLIQCVVNLPSERDTEGEHKKKVTAKV